MERGVVGKSTGNGEITGVDISIDSVVGVITGVRKILTQSRKKKNNRPEIALLLMRICVKNSNTKLLPNSYGNHTNNGMSGGKSHPLIMDASGRVVDAKSQIGSNSTIQIGHNYSNGTYYAELIQGTKRKVVQLIKGRG